MVTLDSIAQLVHDFLSEILCLNNSIQMPVINLHVDELDSSSVEFDDADVGEASLGPAIHHKDHKIISVIVHIESHSCVSNIHYRKLSSEQGSVQADQP